MAEIREFISLSHVEVGSQGCWHMHLESQTVISHCTTILRVWPLLTEVQPASLQSHQRKEARSGGGVGEWGGELGGEHGGGRHSPHRAETIRNTELEGTLGARTGERLPEVPRGSSTAGGLGAWEGLGAMRGPRFPVLGGGGRGNQRAPGGGGRSRAPSPASHCPRCPCSLGLFSPSDLATT